MVEISGGELLLQQGLAATTQEGVSQILSSIESGKALEVFRKMLVAQGVEERVSEAVCKFPETVLPLSCYTTDIKSPKSGKVIGIDPLKCAEVSGVLGAGRLKPGEPVTHNTGIQLFKKVGSMVEENECWAKVYHVSVELPQELLNKLNSALSLGNELLHEETKSKIYSVIKENN